MCLCQVEGADHFVHGKNEEATTMISWDSLRALKKEVQLILFAASVVVVNVVVVLSFAQALYKMERLHLLCGQ